MSATPGSISVTQKRCGLESDSKLGAEIVPRIHGVESSSLKPAELRASLRLGESPMPAHLFLGLQTCGYFCARI